MIDRTPICYIISILQCVHNSLLEHIDYLDKILPHLAAVGVLLNADKSKRCKQEIYHRGFTIKPTTYIPMQCRIKSILEMTPPKISKEFEALSDVSMTSKTTSLAKPNSCKLSPNQPKKVFPFDVERS